MRKTICALILAGVGLFASHAESASHVSPFHPETKEKKRPSATYSLKRPKYDACFKVKNGNECYIVTEKMDNNTGIITSDIIPADKYSGPPHSCETGKDIHQSLANLVR